MKNIKNIHVELNDSLNRFKKLVPRRTVLTDPFRTPIETKDKELYLRIYELTSYIKSLFWVCNKDVDDKIDNLLNGKISLEEILGDNPKLKNEKEIKKNMIDELNYFSKANKRLENDYYNELEKNIELKFDGDPNILAYERRRMRSILLGEVKSFLWILGENENGIDLQLNRNYIDDLDILRALEGE